MGNDVLTVLEQLWKDPHAIYALTLLLCVILIICFVPWSSSLKRTKSDGEGVEASAIEPYEDGEMEYDWITLYLPDGSRKTWKVERGAYYKDAGFLIFDAELSPDSSEIEISGTILITEQEPV